MHPIRSVGSLSGTCIEYSLVHSAHKFEHNMVLFKRKFLLDFYALDQLLYTRRLSTCTQHPSSAARDTYRWGPEKEGVIFLRTVKVCPPGIARKGFDALLECQDVPDHLPDTVRVGQTNPFGFRNQEMLK